MLNIISHKIVLLTTIRNLQQKVLLEICIHQLKIINQIFHYRGVLEQVQVKKMPVNKQTSSKHFAASKHHMHWKTPMDNISDQQSTATTKMKNTFLNLSRITMFKPEIFVTYKYK